MALPWGKFEVILDNENCKVKKITVDPKKRLSYQSHKHRAEVWVVVSGEGKITINDEVSTVGVASIVMVPFEVKHRIENTHATDDLIFIETQLGTYFGEDDIIRYEDDWGRHRENWTTSYVLGEDEVIADD